MRLNANCPSQHHSHNHGEANRTHQNSIMNDNSKVLDIVQFDCAGGECAVKPRVVADDPGVHARTHATRVGSTRRVPGTPSASRTRNSRPAAHTSGTSRLAAEPPRSRIEAAGLSSGCRGPDLPARARARPPSPAAACRRRNASRRGPRGSQTSVSPRRRTRRRATRRGPVPAGSCAG